jgi:branched-chain amino acid transport system substrate-binding protein
VKKRILLFTFVFIAMSFSGCGNSEKKSKEESTVKLGTIQSLTGDISVLGISSKNGVMLAVKEINEKGGILGKKIEVMVEDDGGIPEKTAKAFEKLHSKDNIVGLIGPLKSGCSLAITKEVQKKKIVMITHSSTNEKVTDAGDYIFRACFIDPFQGKVNADFAANNLKAKKAAVMFDNANDYSGGLKDSFVENFQKTGGEVGVIEGYDPKQTDFKDVLNKIKTLNPEVIFIPDGYEKVSLIAKQIRSHGIKSRLQGGDGWETISKNAGDEVKGAYYSNHFISTISDKEVKAFLAKYKAEYNVEPTAFSAQAYDAMYIYAEAVERAKTFDGEKVKTEMMNTNRKFVTGKIKFDEKRNPVKPALMIKVDKIGGKLVEVYAATVDP